MFNSHHNLRMLHAVFIIAVVFVSQITEASVLRDPMRPDNTSAKTKAATVKAPQTHSGTRVPKRLQLHAISYSESESKRSAIINGAWVKMGSSVNGAKVIRITASTVELTRNGKSVTVRLVPQIKRNPDS